MSKKSYNPQLVMGTTIPEILMYDFCCKNKKKKNPNGIKKLVSRELKYNTKTSEFKRVKFISETERKIVEFLYKIYSFFHPPIN